MKTHLSTMALATGAFMVVALEGSSAMAAPPTTAQPPASVLPAEHPVTVTAPPEVEQPAQNSIFAEGLGAGILYSLNYERMVTNDLGVRGGFGYWSVGASATVNGQTSGASASYLSLPLTLSYIGVRSGKHALELGGGATLFHASGAASGFGVAASDSVTTGFGNLMVGYRIHPIGHAGFNFRVGAMALIGKGLALSTPDPEKIGVLPWLYLSMGASF